MTDQNTKAALRHLFEQERQQGYAPAVARGLHLKNANGSFQVSSIELEFEAWVRGYHAAHASQQAEIDRLLLEFCHGEMSQAQKDEWARSQRRAVEPACSCPSGDGSLRWPCAAHPPVAPQAPEAQKVQTARVDATCPDCGSRYRLVRHIEMSTAGAVASDVAVRDAALEFAAEKCDALYAARAAHGFPREASAARRLAEVIRSCKFVTHPEQGAKS